MSDWSESIPEVNAACMDVFGRPFVYVELDDGQEHNVTGILDEGSLDEPVSPGRYVRFTMLFGTLPFTPVTGDQIRLGEASYDITEVVANDEYKSYQFTLRKAGA